MNVTGCGLQKAFRTFCISTAMQEPYRIPESNAEIRYTPQCSARSNKDRAGYGLAT